MGKQIKILSANLVGGGAKLVKSQLKKKKKILNTQPFILNCGDGV